MFSHDSNSALVGGHALSGLSITQLGASFFRLPLSLFSVRFCAKFVENNGLTVSDICVTQFSLSSRVNLSIGKILGSGLFAFENLLYLTSAVSVMQVTDLLIAQPYIFCANYHYNKHYCAGLLGADYFRFMFSGIETFLQWKRFFFVSKNKKLV